MVDAISLQKKKKKISVISWRSVLLVEETTDLPQVTDYYFITYCRTNIQDTHFSTHCNVMNRVKLGSIYIAVEFSPFYISPFSDLFVHRFSVSKVISFTVNFTLPWCS